MEPLSSDHTEFPFSVIVTEKPNDFSVTMTISGLKTPFWAIVPQKLPDFSVTICSPPRLLGNQVCGDILLTLTIVMVICDDVHQISDDCAIMQQASDDVTIVRSGL